MFKIISESSVAAGIRRIEAKTGKECEELMYNIEDVLKAIRGLFNNAKDLQGVIGKYIEEHDAMKKNIEQFQRCQQITLEQIRELLVFLNRNLQQEFTLFDSVGYTFANYLMSLAEGQALAYQIIGQISSIGEVVSHSLSHLIHIHSHGKNHITIYSQGEFYSVDSIEEAFLVLL